MNINLRSFNLISFREQWPVATVYSNEKKARSVGFRRIYLMLDEATLTFNSSADEVIVANTFELIP